MADKQLRGKLEARARALAAERIIPPDKQQIVEAILQNSGLSPEEKYRTVVNLVKTCPVRTALSPIQRNASTESRSQKETRQKVSPKKGSTLKPQSIEDQYLRFRSLKLFRKRYLCHGDNRFGIGIKKRLIPTRRLLVIMKDVQEFQRVVMEYYHEVIQNILNDQSILDPLPFNYLRLFRAIVASIPLAELNYDVIKWMDSSEFERDLRPHASQFFSFLLLNAESRENIISQFETALRGCDEFRREVESGDDESDRRMRQKRNLRREEAIFDIMLHLRSFLPASRDEDTVLTRFLRNRYGIDSYPELLHIMMESLVLQKPVLPDELNHFLNCVPPEVSKDRWDYNSDYLKTIGKDQASIRDREIRQLKSNLIPYDRIIEFTEYGGGPGVFLLKVAEDQWHIIDRNRYDVHAMSQSHAILYLDALIQYFQRFYLPFLNGTAFVLKDPESREWESPVFDRNCLTGMVHRAESLARSLHEFRTLYPTLVISTGEISRIMTGRMKTMDHAAELFRTIGDYFHDLGEILNRLIEAHLSWLAAGGVHQNSEDVHKPLQRPGDKTNIQPAPFPFFDCILESFPESHGPAALIKGKRILETQPEGGIVMQMTSFCYQMARLCHSEGLYVDLEKRKEILTRLKYLRLT